MSRFRLVLLIGILALAGCDETQFSGPIKYREHERVAKDLADKPRARELITKTLVKIYGEDLRHIKVPDDSGLRENGLYLANYVRIGEKREQVFEKDSLTGKPVPILGGYALYRRNCLQCHGVFGAGDGPTSDFLYPRPRDYRPGIYKFTSTNPVNAKPTRADLRKTIQYGLHGTSMPGFDATLSPTEIEQVIDYMTFLSMRGETERYLIDEAMTAEDKSVEDTLNDEFINDVVTKVTSSWKEAETGVVNPSTRRVESSPESIQRGRDLYLSVSTNGPQLKCTSCHGASGKGNGEAFIEPDIFRDVTLRRWPLDQAIARTYTVQKVKLSANSHEAEKPKPSKTAAELQAEKEARLKAIAEFLEANPKVVAQLRKNRGLLVDVSDKDFESKFKSDPTLVVSQSLKLLPELEDPDFRVYLVTKMDQWVTSLDFWGNPLRPANLLEGTYKGGRRPLELYWRIAKGINGAQMPVHAGLMTDDQIWDVVNFVLALPENQALLPESLPTPAKVSAVAVSPDQKQGH